MVKIKIIYVLTVEIKMNKTKKKMKMIIRKIIMKKIMTKMTIMKIKKNKKLMK